MHMTCFYDKQCKGHGLLYDCSGLGTIPAKRFSTGTLTLSKFTWDTVNTLSSVPQTQTRIHKHTYRHTRTHAHTPPIHPPTSAVLEALMPIFFSGGPLEGNSVQGCTGRQCLALMYSALHSKKHDNFQTTPPRCLFPHIAAQCTPLPLPLPPHPHNCLPGHTWESPLYNEG